MVIQTQNRAQDDIATAREEYEKKLEGLLEKSNVIFLSKLNLP
jgi:hypothetical protein